MRTTGFKRQRAEFQDLLYEQVRRVGSQTSDQGNILPAGVELGSGVKTVGTPRVMTQGTLSPTGKDFDVAIRGEGFFKILLPDGRTAYTRDGSFALDAQGRITTNQGYVVQPGLTVPQNASQITINANGQVSVMLPGNTDPTLLGQIELSMFINKAGLQGVGDNLYLETAASGTPQNGLPNADGFGNLQQGNLEQANVEAVTEISDLIAAQRAYEMNAKVINAADQMLSSTSNLIR
jgi:flagellar basal-body rod protein FlgG